MSNCSDTQSTMILSSVAISTVPHAFDAFKCHLELVEEFRIGCFEGILFGAPVAPKRSLERRNVGRINSEYPSPTIQRTEGDRVAVDPRVESDNLICVFRTIADLPIRKTHINKPSLYDVQ